jgi:hypothetical protein
MMAAGKSQRNLLFRSSSVIHRKDLASPTTPREQ